MGNVVIKVENLSKQYRLGLVGSGTLRDDIIGWWHKIRGKENPLLKVGEINERDKASNEKYVWSLKDINFEVNEGDVLGIIGKNGAGKSTLLKILSKVTAPTTGSVKTKGKIASLLEVGTGFHPELTGKENIYLNGAILGMRRQEITLKLDEIVHFAGVERYLETPVKRYSSGMYVRLAFAVAAHLSSDILIVDEVLAVGDSDFQKRCLGKMKDLSYGQGRTVLFVSHNMDSIERLCKKALLLKDGNIDKIGETTEIINKYLIGNNRLISKVVFNESDCQQLKILKAYVHDENYEISDNFSIIKKVGISFEFFNNIEESYIWGIDVIDERENIIFISHDVDSEYNTKKLDVGFYKSTVWIPENLLAEGIFSIGIGFFKQAPAIVYLHQQNILRIKITDYMQGNSARGNYNGNFPGFIRPKLSWQTSKV
jgi:lipopolysaccharide transport system ATP-binding protein